ncbi:sensor histidine kinase [Quadrisphaera granulorum]|uniref:sensor histidine kinase n=1 Tax=Quadrisphaera granulorum TaxID=317664 RepID=UPI000D6B94C2|nr:HAMP domain-containing sensor histidine kinase [Quadrisphaera granulorum]
MAWSATVVVAAWMAVLAALAVVVVGVALDRAADDSLRARAQAVTATAQVRADGSVTVLEGPDDQALDTDTWVIAADGALVEGPAGAGAAPPRVAELAARVLGADGELVDTVDADAPTRLLGLPVHDQSGQPVAAVVTAASLVPYQQLRELTLVAVTVLALLLVVGVHLVLRAAVARALMPVAAMSRQVDAWSTSDPTQRLGEGPRPTELASLAGTLDALLDRIAAALRHEQVLTAELSHELRTPLAGMRAELDWVRKPARSDAQRQESLAELDTALRRAEGVVEGLLASARSATAAPGRCEVAPAVERVLAARRAADAPGRTEDVNAVALRADVDQTLAVGVEAAVLERALSPLVDNAYRYARSIVLVTAHRDQAQVRITIADDGPGIPADLIARVLEPGFRADPGEQHRGSGLGLPLAARLARTAGGDLLPQAAGADGGGVLHLLLPAA